MVDRNVRFRSQQHQDRIRRQAHRAGAVDFFNVLTGPELLEMTEAHLPEHRERLYPPSVTLAMFMKQVLAADRSCQRAVNAWAAQRAVEGLSVQSIRTGAYCQARQRLPLPDGHGAHARQRPAPVEPSATRLALARSLREAGRRDRHLDAGQR